MKSWLMLPLRATSGSVVTQQQGLVSMSVGHVTTKDHVDVPGLGYCLGCAELAPPITSCATQELAPPLPSSSTWESGNHMVPVKHSRADPGGGVWESWLCPSPWQPSTYGYGSMSAGEPSPKGMRDGELLG